MIRFINENEDAAEHASDLVGKYVGKDNVMKFRAYGRPMLVTEYSGSRIYGKIGLYDTSAKGEDSRMRPSDEWDEDTYIQFKSIAYVCDTIEDCNALVRANKQSMRIWQEGEARIKRETNEIFESLVSEHPLDPRP